MRRKHRASYFRCIYVLRNRVRPSLSDSIKFPSCLRNGNAKSCFRHISVIFKSGRNRCCSFPLCFCDGFLIVKVTEENIEESYTLPAIEHHDNGRAPTIMWGLKIYFPAYRVSLDILSLNSIKAFCVLINNHTFYWTRTTTWNLPGPSGTRDCINIVNLSHRSPLFCGG